MQNNSVNISVLMPVYKPNMGWFTEAIRSLASQTYTNWQLVLSFDGEDENTDKAIAVAKSIIAKDNHIVITRDSHKGIVDCLNRGLSYCQTEFTARMDADDICEEHRLAEQLEMLQANMGMVGCGTQIVAIDETGCLARERLHTYPQSDLRVLATGACFNTPFAHPSLMFRTNAVKRIGGYSFVRSMEDYELGGRLSRIGTIGNLATVGLRYRIHTSQHSRQTRPKRNDLLRTRASYSMSLSRRYGCAYLLTIIFPVALWILGPHGEYWMRRVGGTIAAKISQKSC